MHSAETADKELLYYVLEAISCTIWRGKHSARAAGANRVRLISHSFSSLLFTLPFKSVFIRVTNQSWRALFFTRICEVSSEDLGLTRSYSLSLDGIHAKVK